MDCGACERRLSTVLSRLDGVGRVDADHRTGVVRVRFDAARMTPDALIKIAAERVTQAGFTVTGGGQHDGESRP
jgi:copper chaperone CopZ